MIRLARRLAALAGLLAILAGVPAGLWHFVGWPLPRRIPTTWAGWERILTSPFPDEAVANLLAIALWIVWASFVYSVWVEWRATRGAARRQLPGMFSPVQALAALLVAAIATGPVALAAAPPAPPPAAVQVHPTPARTVADLADPHGRWRVAPTAHPPMSVAPAAAPAVRAGDLAATHADVGRPPRFAAAGFDGLLRVQVGNQHYTYTVRKHDTLWDIAGAWLGDHSRWPEIYHLNADRYDQHGRMRHGDHIEPGWVLILPGDARPPASAAPTPPHPPAGQQPPPAPPAPPTSPAPGATSPAPSAPASTAPCPPANVAPTAEPSAPAAGGAPATPAPTGSRSTAASPSPTATNASPPSRSPRANPPGISLPGGSWVDLGLAAAIAAAATLVWIHRRRRYVPRPPSPTLRLDDPDLAPMPPVVTQVRRGLRRARQAPDDAGIDLVLDTDQPPPDTDGPDLDVDRDLVDVDGDLDRDQGEAASERGADPGSDAEPGEAAADLHGTGLETDPGLVPVAPALDHPLLAVWPPAGLGLTGPGGDAAARGFLVAALAADGRSEPEARSRVVIPAATLATLLGTEAVQVADTPRLSVTAGLPEALEALEAATLHRTRLVYDHEADTVAALRDTDPLEEPLPPLLLIADATAVHERARIAALLTQGQRLDIHGVLLGVWADGNTVHVDADGATRPADGDAARHGAHPADIGRLAVVDPTETADLLRTLAEAHTGQRQPAPPVEAAPPTAPRAGRVPNDEKATSAWPPKADSGTSPDPAGIKSPPPLEPSVPDAATQPASATGTGSTSAGRPSSTPDIPAVIVGPAEPGDDGINQAAPAGADEPGHQPGEPADRTAEPVAASERTATGGPGRARVFLLGPPRIDNLPPPSRTNPLLRPQAMELLVYLVVHGGSADKDRILEDVLGDAPRSKAPGRLSTYVYSLRRSLKTSASGAEHTYVGTPDEDYTLNRDAIDIDLWRMEAAIARADAATDPPVRIAALREAVASYTGPLAQGKTYEWIEPYREAVRQQALDAHLALVAELSDTDLAAAVRVLQAAIDHDPHNDALYQQAMRLQARLGDAEAIRGLRKTLTRRLGDIDAEPADDTLALADQLITDLQQRPRAPRPLPGDAA